MRAVAAAIGLMIAFGSPASSEDAFRYHSPGVLASGVGRTGDRYIYFPDFMFPLQAGPQQGGIHAYANSQVYSTAGGDSALNYSYPWKDTYCEKREWEMPLCPGKNGHQGVDIRPHGNNKSIEYPVLSVADGIVAAVTSFTRVEVRYKDTFGPYTCRYLHMNKASIASLKPGQAVRKGDKLGSVSNIMGGKPNTSWHLHFDCKRNIDGVAVHPPVYTSLISAYRRAWGLDDLNGHGQLGVDPKREVGASESGDGDPESVGSHPKTWATRNYGAITPQTEPANWPDYIKTWPGLDATKAIRDRDGKIIPAFLSDESGVGVWWYWLTIRAGFNPSGTLSFRELATKYAGAQASTDPAVKNYLTNYVGDGSGGGGIARHYFSPSPKADDRLRLDDPGIRWSVAQTVFHFEAGKPAPFQRDVFERGIVIGERVISSISADSQESATGSSPVVAKAEACDANTLEVTRQNMALKVSGCLKQSFIFELLKGN